MTVPNRLSLVPFSTLVILDSSAILAQCNMIIKMNAIILKRSLPCTNFTLNYSSQKTIVIEANSSTELGNRSKKEICLAIQ